MEVLNNFLDDVTSEIKKLGINIKRVFIKDGFLTLKIGNREIKLKQIPKLNDNIFYTITQVLNKFLSEVKGRIDKLRNTLLNKNSSKNNSLEILGTLAALLLIIGLLIILTNWASRIFMKDE